MLSNAMIPFVAPLALATPSLAQSDTPPTRKGDRMVCKSQVGTGTRFRKKVCKSFNEWEQIRFQHQRDAKETIDRPQIETRRE